jgi:FkbM family methyltransferase
VFQLLVNRCGATMINTNWLLRKIKRFGRKLNFELINAADPAELFSVLVKHRSHQDAQSNKDRAFLHFVLQNFGDSKAQLFQDLFVLFSLDQKRAGFFVEIGASNGIELSNTVLLERGYGWGGILAEPAKCWHEDLKMNRNCVIDTRCVWTKSGEVLDFNEVSSRELSTINKFSNRDGHRASRQRGKIYPVETVSLNDLLSSNNAPSCIDYLSVDTEGSEFDILQAFDFQKYDIKVITVEHAFTEDRDRIHALLISKGFSRTLEKLSMWDDWYVKAQLTVDARQRS